MRESYLTRKRKTLSELKASPQLNKAIASYVRCNLPLVRLSPYRTLIVIDVVCAMVRDPPQTDCS